MGIQRQGLADTQSMTLTFPRYIFEFYSVRDRISICKRRFAADLNTEYHQKREHEMCHDCIAILSSIILPIEEE